MMDGKQLARRIFLRTLDELDVASSISRCLAFAHGALRCGELEFQLTKSSDLRVVAVGKAAHGMLDGMLSVLPPEVAPLGIVSAARAPAKPHPHFKYFLGGHPTPNERSLASGKAALELLTKAWAAEYGPSGVRVNAVSPGPTRTEGSGATGEGLEQLAAQVLAGRPATADEITEAIVFLATDRASFIHGAILPVDGGRSAICSDSALTPLDHRGGVLRMRPSTEVLISAAKQTGRSKDLK